MAESSSYIQGSLFEDGFLRRSIKNGITTNPNTAITELVANAWDAGATEVDITIPSSTGNLMIISDNGEGMTREEFLSRWMTLSYNRAAHQNSRIQDPTNGQQIRLTYGRNGEGRHGLLCFGDLYTVKTRKEGTEWTFVVSAREKKEALAILQESSCKKEGQGTELSVVVENTLPDSDKISQVISTRFIYDPQFVVKVNGCVLQIDDLEGLMDTQTLVSDDGIKMTASLVRTKSSAKRGGYQGIAFWQAGRLIGSPSWRLGDVYEIDGRTVTARRYNVIIQSNDFADLIHPDWSGFIRGDKTNNIFKTVSLYVEEVFSRITQENITETKQDIVKDLKKEYSEASPLARMQADETIEVILKDSPTTTRDTIKTAVKAVLNLQSSSEGEELLRKLSSMTATDIAELNKILSRWNVKDAMKVLDVIDKRLTVIELIKKLSEDPNTDELHMLHPLITESRWVFGPEFDSPEYTANQQVRTITQKLFHHKAYDSSFNLSKRPDLVVLEDGSCYSVTGTNRFENGITHLDHVLIVELKKGHFKITFEEFMQLQRYVTMILQQEGGNIHVTSFILGYDIDDGVVSTEVKGAGGGIVIPMKFSQLIDTADKRMMNLRDQLTNMYDDVDGMDLYRQYKFKW